MKHDVTAKLPSYDLGNTDFGFKVRQDGEILGTLKISKGALVWVPKNATYGHRVAWKDLAALMTQAGRPERRRNP